MRWLAEWVKEDFVEPGIARCMDPPPMREKLLLTTPASAFQCKSKYYIEIYSENRFREFRKFLTGLKETGLLLRREILERVKMNVY